MYEALKSLTSPAPVVGHAYVYGQFRKLSHSQQKYITAKLGLKEPEDKLRGKTDRAFRICTRARERGMLYQMAVMCEEAQKKGTTHEKV